MIWSLWVCGRPATIYSCENAVCISRKKNLVWRWRVLFSLCSHIIMALTLSLFSGWPTANWPMPCHADFAFLNCFECWMNSISVLIEMYRYRLASPPVLEECWLRHFECDGPKCWRTLNVSHRLNELILWNWISNDFINLNSQNFVFRKFSYNLTVLEISEICIWEITIDIDFES